MDAAVPAQAVHVDGAEEQRERKTWYAVCGGRRGWAVRLVDAGMQYGAFGTFVGGRSGDCACPLSQIHSRVGIDRGRRKFILF